MRRLTANPTTVLGMALLMVSLAVLSCGQPAAPSPTAASKQPAAAQPTSAAPLAAATTAPAVAKPAPPTSAASAPKELTVVHAADLGSGADAYTYIAIERGYFKEQGIQVELTRFKTSADMIAPMAAGQLDVGRGSSSAGILNAVGRGLPLKIVADSSRVMPNNNYFGLVARKELVESGKLKDYADMKGMNVAYNSKGTGNEIDIEKALKKGNLTRADVNLVEISFPDMNAALANGAVDLALMPEPFQTIVQESGTAVFWKPGADFTPNHELSVLMYAPQFMKDKPEVAKRYMVAYIKGIRDFSDGFFKDKGKSDIISILTKYTTTKAAVYEKTLAQGVDPDGYVNAQNIMDDQEWFIANGYVKDKIEENVLIDNQYVDYAVQQLGKYQR